MPHSPPSLSAPTMAASFHVRLVRHGETDDNVRRVIASHTPSPLNATGRRQADALGAAWRAEGAAFRRVYSSDTSRVLETCQRALAAAGLAPQPEPCLEPLLSEREGGALEGLSFEEAGRMQAESLRTGVPIAGMETLAEGQRRVGGFFGRLVDEMTADGAGGGEAAVFTHGSIMLCLLLALQREHGLQLTAEQLPAGDLHVSWNTAQTRLLVSRDPAGAVTVSCEFLHRDDHLTGDLAPAGYLMPSGKVVPKK
ncbi:probable phosphoglycerate mutase GpmB isoform X1 [Amphibalanus amphitrite]|uniref:probable phosphoglycerate mutase GpmB isoform X1 n=1 Tax=Amphibalanus amphitrite TaxID=1232801 RepID=UPI001C907CC3|nr:probable phosphoglycerate mutase GpmB isoform X1 [Amphibalanus amphitrite]